MQYKKTIKIIIPILLSICCFGILYVNSFSSTDKSEESITQQIEKSTAKTDSQNIKSTNTAKNYSSLWQNYGDADLLKLMPNQEALALLVEKGNLNANNDEFLYPFKPVSVLEFLNLAFTWSDNDNLTTSNSMIDNPSASEFNQENLISLGFKEEIPLLLKAANYEIPLFYDNPYDYHNPISNNQASLILSCLSKNLLKDELNRNNDLENYIDNAFSLRLDPEFKNIEKLYNNGIFSVKENPIYIPESQINRSQAANLLMRLFHQEKRITNPVKIREKLKPNDSQYYSEAIYLFNNTTKQTVFAKNENEIRMPASLTKIMTVYLAIDLIPNLNDKVRVSSSFRHKMKHNGASLAGFYANERVSYEDLLYATMLPSGAEAAGTLAIQLAGSEADFIELMNQKAQHLGMFNTHFATVEGLDTEGQQTTARDIAILLESALKNPTFYKIFTSPYFKTSKTRAHPRGLSLHSTVLKNIDDSEEIDFHILGGKSGTTSGAGLCWATLSEKNGNSYILVTLGAPLDNIYNPTMYQKLDTIEILNQLP